nr:retrotransposon protein [Tanacetum cinerariifolium]
ICLGIDLEPDKWIKDSGCSKHMTSNRNLFSSYKAYNGGIVISGSNLRGNIIGKGTISNDCWALEDSSLHKDKIKITTDVGHHHKENSKWLKKDQEKDKIGSKPDKNGKRGEAGKERIHGFNSIVRAFASLGHDLDAAHIVAASKVLMLKPEEFELWRMNIEQYIQMMDYALWDVIKNGNSIPKTQTVNNVKIVIPPTNAEEKLQRMN